MGTNGIHASPEYTPPQKQQHEPLVVVQAPTENRKLTIESLLNEPANGATAATTGEVERVRLPPVDTLGIR